jgi:CheY-like chemotaxis protein
MEPKKQLRILCVDDEPNVLEGLSLNLRRRYAVETATSGERALEVLEGGAPIAVIISDMRMPKMDGATFLARARQRVPDAVRILLTGQADLDSAIAAINEGQIFRFLTKPCPPALLVAAVDAAAEQHRLVTSERVLLEQTLHGSIKALTDVLSLTDPVSFGRANRVKRNVSDLAAKLDMSERWQVEVAAMLSQLGTITLPAETAEKMYFGRPLSENEQTMVARLPVVVEDLLGNIPRLEIVRAMLAECAKSGARANDLSEAQKQLVHRGAHVLKAAIDFDVLESQGISPSLALDAMRGRADRYDPQVFEALVALRWTEPRPVELLELPVHALRGGMVVAEDMRLQTGALLVARGYEITESFLARLRNFKTGAVREPVRVQARTGKKEKS